MLELRTVTAGYAGAAVLRDLDLVVPDGRVVALLGPNGAGKTTTLRIAGGLLKPMSGQVVVDDVVLTGKATYRFAAAGVCHIPEGRGIFPSLTVRDNLLVQANGTDGETAIARAISAFPRLGQRLDQVAGTMSGGEQQMLAISRSYVQNPRFVLLDEVSMGLAPKVVDEIFEFIGLLAEQGSSLLLVEQYVTRALAVADFVYLLNGGTVRFAGEPSELDGEDLFSQYVGSHEVGAAG